MNVNTILISKEQAQQKLDEYRSIVDKKRVAEDNKLQSLYAAVSKGARVLNLAAAFKQTGLNEFKQPKLAMARADWQMVHCYRWSETGTGWGLRFTHRNTGRNYVSDVRVPMGMGYNEIFDSRIRSRVPHVPPSCRPKYSLSNYHILFEVEKWEEYPVDPFLLRRIEGMLFVVEAEWELTPLEASLLSAMTHGT